MSSWIAGLADKAENILNKIDQNAATALEPLDTIKRSVPSSQSLMTLSPVRSGLQSEEGLPRKRLNWQIGDEPSPSNSFSSKVSSIAIDVDNESPPSRGSTPTNCATQMSPSVPLSADSQELTAFKIALNEVTNERDELRLRLSTHDRDIENAGLKQRAVDLEAFVLRLTEEREQTQLELRAAQSTGAAYVHSISELETNLLKLQQEYREVAQKLQLQARATELQRQELQDYRAKAHCALQLKDGLIAQLKSSGAAEAGVKTADDADADETRLLRLECDALKQEQRHTIDENSNLLRQLEQLRGDMNATHKQHAEQLSALRVSADQLRQELRIERERNLAGESEHRVLAQELETLRQQLSNQMAAAATRLQEKEQQVLKLRAQQLRDGGKAASGDGGTACPLGDYGARIKTLTQTLVDKQNSVERLTAERNALRIQMEKLQEQLAIYSKNLQASHSRSTLLSNSTDDVKAQYPLLMKANPFDNRVARRVKRAYSSLDSAGIRLGAFLRRYPLMRVFVLMYVALLHIWVIFVLLSTTPN